MKKNILLFFFAILITGLQAQNVTLDPQIVDIDHELADDIEGPATVTNTANEMKRFIWERTEVEMPSEWNSAVCDKNRCYLPFVSTEGFDLDAMTGGDMIVHVYPDGVVGTAKIEVKIYEEADPNNTITGVYNFTVGTSSTVELNRQLVKLFPNPTQGDINLQFLLDRPTQMRVEIQNIIGQSLSTVDYGKLSGAQTLQLNQQELNNGIYFVVIHMDEYVMTRKIKVSK